jgi:methanogenic corrinoid protein MtbC1
MDPLGRDGRQSGSWTGDDAVQPGSQPAAGACGEPAERLAWLVSTIEAEIIPRLLLAHRSAPRPRRQAPEPGEVESFAAMAVGRDAGAVKARVDALRAGGLALEDIYLKLLAPAARHLGEQWTADTLDFAGVTTALWRLQQVMYDLSPAFQGECAADDSALRALLVPVPGSQHTFGLLMVGEFFQRAGWDVATEPSITMAVLLDTARSSWFDVVGLSCGSVCHLPAATQAVAALRSASMNPRVGIMVGGPLFVGHPELVEQVGADGTADDAAQAVACARRLVEQSRVEPRRAVS